MRNEDFINDLISESPEPNELATELVEVRGIPGTYYPRQADWAVRWLGFFNTISPQGKQILRNLPLCKMQCCYCIWHTVTDSREKNERLAERHWFDKHTSAGKAIKRTKPLVINYDGEPPF